MTAHSGRGSITRSFNRSKRFKTDEAYKTKRAEEQKSYNEANKEKVKTRYTAYVKMLSEFRNRKCKKCGKLLNYSTIGDYCFKHRWLGREKWTKK